MWGQQGGNDQVLWVMVFWALGLLLRFSRGWVLWQTSGIHRRVSEELVRVPGRRWVGTGMKCVGNVIVAQIQDVFPSGGNVYILLKWWQNIVQSATVIIPQDKHRSSGVLRQHSVSIRGYQLRCHLGVSVGGGCKHSCQKSEQSTVGNSQGR